MTKFQPRDSSENGAPGVNKAIIGASDGLHFVLGKDAIDPEAQLADVHHRVTRPHTAGNRRDLSELVAEIRHQIGADDTGSRALSTEERIALRDRIVTAMSPDGTQPQRSAVIDLASLMVGLEGDVTGEKFSTGTLRKSFDKEFFVPIFKVDATKREIHGVMAEERKDKAGEIFDYASSKPHVQAWSAEAVKSTTGAGQEISFGNVRGQHGKVAAGKLVGISFDDANKQIAVIAKIVDDNEWEKVEQGVYTGFSIGGDYVKRWPDGSAIRYTARPRELSIVDNPCMHGAKFTMVKLNGTSVEKSFASSAPPSPLSESLANLRGRISELAKNIDDLLRRRAAQQQRNTRFVPAGVNSDDAAQSEFNKAWANKGKPFFLADSGAEQPPSPRFVPEGVTKADAANAELQKALANGRPA